MRLPSLRGPEWSRPQLLRHLCVGTQDCPEPASSLSAPGPLPPGLPCFSWATLPTPIWVRTSGAAPATHQKALLQPGAQPPHLYVEICLHRIISIDGLEAIFLLQVSLPLYPGVLSNLKGIPSSWHRWLSAFPHHPRGTQISQWDILGNFMLKLPQGPLCFQHKMC